MSEALKTEFSRKPFREFDTEFISVNFIRIDLTSHLVWVVAGLDGRVEEQPVGAAVLHGVLACK